MPQYERFITRVPERATITPPRRTPEGTSPQDATTASSPSVPRKAPSVKDVAALAGVSVGSVSTVINRRDSVRPDVRERVEAAIARDMAARAEANRAGEPLARTTEQTGDAITALI